MPEGLKFSYYTGNEAEQYTFYRVPKLLFTAEAFRTVSCEAKVLYGLFLDRMGLSIKNRWLDKEDRVYIMFPIEEITDLLGFGSQKVCKLMKELETTGLIKRKRLGLGKPNIIYVKNFIITETKAEQMPADEDTAETNAEHTEGNKTQNKAEYRLNPLNCENQKSRIVKCENQEITQSKIKNCENQNSGISRIKIQEFPKSKSNNTEYSDTDISDTEYSDIHIGGVYTGDSISINPIYPDTETQRKETYRAMICKNVKYDSLVSGRSGCFNISKINELIDIMAECMLLPDDTRIRINNTVMSAGCVKEQLNKLGFDHMEYVLECLAYTTGHIRNIKSYLLTTLYNAPMTMENYYQAQVNHDLNIMRGT